MIFKRLASSLIRKLGYEVHRVTGEPVTNDAFYDEQNLLSDIPVQTIFDVGAHIGETTAEYNRFFPKATIYSFEPAPEASEELRRRFEGNSLVKSVQLAVSNKVGKNRFFINQDRSTSSLLPLADGAERWVSSPSTLRSIATIDVPVTTIDDFCKQQSINEIEILKMDIQGGELRALEGATGKLSQGAISLIYAEVLFIPLYTGQALFYEIYDFLSDYGYTLFGMYDIAYSEGSRIKWGNALFVSPRLNSVWKYRGVVGSTGSK
jgi:FkbM family methyltransferase